MRIAVDAIGNEIKKHVREPDVDFHLRVEAGATTSDKKTAPKSDGCGSFWSLLDGRDSDHLHELQVRSGAGRGQRVRDLAVSVA